MPKWISVNEQKPPDYKPVLACQANGIYWLVAWEVELWWEYSTNRIVSDITHWYPLPEPPPVSAPKRKEKTDNANSI